MLLSDKQIENDRILAERHQNEDDDEIWLTAVSSTNLHPSCSLMCPLNLQEALVQIKLANDSTTAKLTTFFVQRSRIWNNVQEWRNSEIKTFKMSVDFIGECAFEPGGPTREFFSTVYKDVMRGKLTRGNMPNLTFTHDHLLFW